MNDDSKIVYQVLHSDKNQYEILMKRYHRELFSFVYNIVAQVQTTEDLLQDIFLKIYKKLKIFDDSKASFRTWMYRIAHNEVINYVKSNKVTKKPVHIEEIDYLKDDQNIEQDVVREEKINLIILAIQKRLKKKHQDIMYLHYFSGLTVKEISEVLSIPDKTIYHAIDSSIAKIKEEVQGYE